VFHIGINQKHLNGYVLVGNSAWRSLVKGEKYQLTFQFDEESPWKGMATATGIGLWLNFDKPDFLVNFARRRNLTLRYEERLITTLSGYPRDPDEPSDGSAAIPVGPARNNAPRRSPRTRQVAL
jgi:hypothetical protein